jgi:hypothetical protein
MNQVVLGPARFSPRVKSVPLTCPTRLGVALRHHRGVDMLGIFPFSHPQ